MANGFELDEKIKRALKVLGPSEWSQEDIDWIKEIDYPIIVKFTFVEELTGEKEVERSFEADSLDALLESFKTAEDNMIIEVESCTSTLKLRKEKEE